MIHSNEGLQHLIESALREDLGDGDHSTLSCISPTARGRAVLHLKQEGILAGMAVAHQIFEWQEPSCRFTPLLRDGKPMLAGQEAFVIEASVRVILQCERLVLNCLQRMSGIATLTRQYVDRIAGWKTRILDTRKTTPNFRLLEKEAVRLGGGYNHRFGLFDMILLKDNHIDYCGGVEAALRMAFAYRERVRPGMPIEIEARNLDEVSQIARIGLADRILLDNFRPQVLQEALDLLAGRWETEASGGINLENIVEYARTGVDFISLGALTHQARSLDMSLKAEIL